MPDVASARGSDDWAMTVESSDVPRTEPQLREQALERLKKRQDFKGHVLVYVLVNALLWTIWAMTGGGFAWPVFATAGWGIGLAMNAWDVFWRKPITERAVDRELERMLRS